MPSTGTTSPGRISNRSPGWIASIGVSASSPSRTSIAVCATRPRRAVISRRARPSANASRYCPPEYIRATTIPASGALKARLAPIERDAAASTRDEIRVLGILSAAFLGAFSGALAEGQVVEAVLRGTLPDQMALYDVLAHLEGLGLELLDVRRVRDSNVAAGPNCGRRRR